MTSTGEKSDRFEELYERALALPTEDRAAFMDEACGGDAGLRRRLEAAVHDRRLAAQSTEEIGSQEHAAAPGRSLVGRTIGKYHIKSVIATGGMGTVYLAVQEQPHRKVALKVMVRGVTSRSALRRFEFESQTLARLNHPNVAKVYEAGTHDDGYGSVQFFAMEYIAGGRTVVQFVSEKRLGTRERLALFAKVCAAVHHGHQRGIIHRDLKPGNILVDAAGEPQIIDFGVARATDSDMAVATLQTDIGQLVGTLQYMSPEQCAADPEDIDIRSDVYALGVVLFEVLTGRVPYSVSRAALAEAARVIREDPPARPSTIDRTLRGDVETITLKALDKDRDRRYLSAEAFGIDIRHYLNNEPILARRPSVAYQMRMLARRNRAPVSAVATVAFVLVAATAVSVFFAIHAQRRGDDLAEAVDQRDAAIARLDDALTASERQAYLASIRAADAAIVRDDVSAARQMLDAAPPGARGWEWHYLTRRLDDSVRAWPMSGPMTVRFDPDGERLHCGLWDVTHRTFDLSSGTEVTRFARNNPGHRTLAISPDGRYAAVVGNAQVLGHIDIVEILDLTQGNRRHLLSMPRGCMAVVFSKDATRLACSEVVGGAVAIFDVDSGAAVATVSIGARLYDLALSPDGRLLAGKVEDGGVGLWSTETDRDVVWLHAEESDDTRAVAFSPDGDSVATSSMDGTLRIHDIETGTVRAWPLAHEGAIAICFSPDGQRLASASTFGTIRIWDVETSRRVASLRGHEGWITDVEFSTDGTRLASVCMDEGVRLWRVEPPPSRLLPNAHDTWVRTVAFSPDGARLVSGSRDGGIRIGDARSGAEARRMRGHTNCVSATCYSADGRTIYSSSWDGTVATWDAWTGAERTRVRAPEPITYGVGLSSSASLVAFGRDDLTIYVTDARTGLTRRFLRANEPIHGVAISRDGDRVASVGTRNQVRFWEIDSRAEVATGDGHEDRICCIEYAPDDSVVVTGSRDGTVRIWDARTGREQQRLDVGVTATAVAISSDGALVAAGTEDGGIHVWDRLAGHRLFAEPGHEARIGCVAFSPDNARIVSGCSGSEVTIRDARSGREALRLVGHVDIVTSVGYADDGRTIVTAGRDNTVRRWDAATGAQLTVRTGPTENPVALRVFPDDAIAVSIEANDNQVIWNVESGNQIAVCRGRITGVLSMTLAPDDAFLACGCWDGSVHLLDPSSGELIRTLHGHDGAVWSVAVDPQGNFVAAGASDGFVRIWDARTGEEVIAVPGHDGRVVALAYAPDGSRVASGGWDRGVRAWDAATGALVAEYVGPNEAVRCVVYSPDGSRLVAGATDWTLHIWRADTADRLIVLKGHDGDVFAATFSPDGAFLASGSFDRSIRVWDGRDTATGK